MNNLDRLIAPYGENPSQLVGILQDMQAEYNHLPIGALARVADRLHVPFSRLYSIATFFKSFTLEPRGRHIITLCTGTACHVRRSPRILDQVSRLLAIGPGETTHDGLFTLETVNCLGTCALGPVAVIDGKYHGNLTTGKIRALLKSYEKVWVR